MICGFVINDTCTLDLSRYSASWWWGITTGFVLCNCLWFALICRDVQFISSDVDRWLYGIPGRSVTHTGATVYPKKYAHGFCFAVLCVVIHWLIFPYPSGLLHWHCGNLTIAPVPAKQPWWIWINTSCESIMNDCITTTKQSTTKPCAYFLGYTVL